MFASAIITTKAAKKVSGGYPWVFDSDLLSRRHETAGIVAVHDKRGSFIGQAFYSPKSKIALRFITRSKKEIKKEFWKTSLKKACEKRSELEKITDAYRIVNAEGDGIPSVVIDRYNDIWAVQITSAGAETEKNNITSAIIEEFQPASVIEKNNVAIRKAEGLPLVEKTAYGEKGKTVIREGAQRFHVDVLNGQKTGAYLDYRGFRLKAAELARGNALDLFCYEGWLACHIAPRAEKVTAVDSSHTAIKMARENGDMCLLRVPIFEAPITTNSSASQRVLPPVIPADARPPTRRDCASSGGPRPASPVATTIEFIECDVFDFLEGCKESYDFIHIDPPPFAKGKKDLASAVRGYEKLNIAAMNHLNPGGVLFTSSCSHHISEGMLENIIKRCCERLGKKYKIIYRGIQDKDHPVLKGLPESLYLKAVAITLS